MQDFSLPKFDDPRKWIGKAREAGKEWTQILYANTRNDEELQKFLENQEMLNFWPKLTAAEWKVLVGLQKSAEENTKQIELLAGIAQIHDEGQDNAVTIPVEPSSSWQLYRKKLIDDGFKAETVVEIEQTTLKILKRLNNDTTESGPVKGLVIGNVQSGKTANMAALMAMAADWGWNMFVVLSGTIESLRVQTQNRLFNDLNQQGTLFWRSLEHLSKKVDLSMKTQNLHFDEGSKERYFSVCLKNSTRLKNLIQWAQADANKQQQMKMLVIDDEADQASINTGKVDAAERKKINKLICALVNGQNEKGEEINNRYRAMNYIGYTATPYANILNEASMESLYPKNFITTLAVSKEYFGPQQIFGYDGETTNFEGLDIVRIIPEEQLEIIKQVHDGAEIDAPETLKDAICWFMCGVACMRIWGYRKPISMLIHTSQKTAHHGNIAKIVNRFLESEPETIISRVHNVWIRETDCFNLKNFRMQYPEYDIPNENINDYPSYEEIEKQIYIILNAGVSHIKLDDEGDLLYNEGIHLCIDNCVNSGITSDGMHVRLAYPEASKMPSPAPAFIVIGGATLSRGLTIEGLMSTFFLRSVGQADTLMQMGRWFGYRKKYELLPRLWVTDKTKEQFKFLAALDQELRDEIQYMDINGMSPSAYGPKVKNSPKVSFIRITAKSKMQSATESDMDYSGASNQTYLFDNDEAVLAENIRTTEAFIASLKKECKVNRKTDNNKNSAVWKNIDVNLVVDFIRNFKFQNRLKVFNDTEPLLKWVQQITREGKLSNWNVIVAGKNSSTNGTWTLPDGTVINKISRSRKNNESELDNNIINIGVLRDPQDILADVDLNLVSDENIRKEVSDFISKGGAKGAPAYRDKAGLETTPQLIIYRIDKNSKAADRGSRINLEAVEDIIGLCLYIPGGRIGTNYASTVSIKMKNDIFDGDADLEGTDED